jgi:hypothetical protein
MNKKKKNIKILFSKAWSKIDKQNFSDRNILKAKTIPSKKKPPPDKKEWD